MLKNPEIILLDEPTSALDSYNEEQVTIALNNLFKNKTVVVIAHRLQTVKHADEIIYIGHDIGRDGLVGRPQNDNLDRPQNDNLGRPQNDNLDRPQNNDNGGRAKNTSLQSSQILERGTHEELLALQ